MTPVKLQEEQLADVAKLESENFSEPWSLSSLQLLLSDMAVGYGLCENGRVVAYGSLLYAPDEGQILNLAVDAAFRKKGYACAILSALEADAKEHGAKALTLEVRASNLPAIKLYEKNGFSAVGKRPNFYRAPTEDALLMKKELN